MKADLSFQTSPAIANTVLKLALVGSILLASVIAIVKVCAAALH